MTDSTTTVEEILDILDGLVSVGGWMSSLIHRKVLTTDLDLDAAVATIHLIARIDILIRASVIAQLEVDDPDKVSFNSVLNRSSEVFNEIVDTAGAPE